MRQKVEQMHEMEAQLEERLKAFRRRLTELQEQSSPQETAVQH